MIRRIGIVAKRNKPEAVDLAKNLISWLAAKNIQVCVDQELAGPTGHPLSCPLTEIRNQIDLLIVLGGDGTLLSAVRAIEGTRIPILGVNLGALGFLTEITLDEFYLVLEKVLAGKIETEERMQLTASVFRKGERTGQYSVLNDVVITKRALARIILLHCSIDGSYVTTYRGDGVIISTPTGSTAYSLAAGGPIVFPTMDSILITPVCPHSLTHRPLLIPQNATVELTLESEDSNVLMTLDGQVGCELSPFDRVVVTKGAETVSFIKPPFRDYFQILRTKLKWGER